MSTFLGQSRDPKGLSHRSAEEGLSLTFLVTERRRGRGGVLSGTLH